jgi:hypothetical protein
MSPFIWKKGETFLWITVKFVSLLKTKRLKYPVGAFPLNLGKKIAK